MRAYLARLDDTSVVRREAKLLLVGEGGTGKSSLLRALRGQDFDAHLSSTHGVDVLPITLPCPDRDCVDLTLNVWDFGGQQIYHTTHQFFMTRRSLYLLVWNARGDTDQGRLDHWLRKIQVLAPGSPVLLVATHSDERPADLNLDRFRAAYPQIAGLVAVSNKTGAGIEELKAVDRGRGREAAADGTGVAAGLGGGGSRAPGGRPDPHQREGIRRRSAPAAA